MCILLDVMIEILERYFNGHRFSKMCRYNVILNEMAKPDLSVVITPATKKSTIGSASQFFGCHSIRPPAKAVVIRQ